MALWSCPTCLKPFKRKGDLTRHQLIHSGIRPHVCGICGKNFTQSSGLKVHVNSTHTGVTLYKCGIGSCKKAFRDPSSRSRHRRETHSLQGAYKCIVVGCGSRIKRCSAYKTHLRKKHGIDPESVDLKAMASGSGEGAVSAPAHSTSSESDLENKRYDLMESRSASPSSLDSEYYTLENGGEASHLTENSGWSDYPFDTQRAIWSSGNDSMRLDPMLDPTIDVCPSNLPNYMPIFPCGGFENPSSFDRFLSGLTLGFPLLGAPSSNTLLEPFVEAGGDGSQSSWSSPSSRSTLYTTDFNLDEDALELSSANTGPQELLQFL